MLNTISDQVCEVQSGLQSLEVFKEELKDVLLNLIQSQNEMKQELFLIRNHLALTSPPPFVY